MRGGSLGLHIMIHGRPHHRLDKHNAQRTFYVFRVIAEQEVGDAHIHRRPTMELVHDCVVATAKGSTLPTRASLPCTHLSSLIRPASSSTGTQISCRSFRKLDAILNGVSSLSPMPQRPWRGRPREA